jgi:regulator of sirC expression with transglutaminase-like and TPR domain
LVLGRRDDARRELSTLPIERVGRKYELRLIRAELRADQDCSAALSDFQVLVEQALPAAFAERALFGRGACLLRLGDDAGAARDFARYLERFPNGRFAAQIRAQR